jgi:hypothetical protein
MLLSGLVFVGGRGQEIGQVADLNIAQVADAPGGCF